MPTCSEPGENKCVLVMYCCWELKKSLTVFWFLQNHESRSATKNRQLARENLIYKLDILYNKENSFDAIQKRENAEKAKKSNSKAEKLRQLKKEFKEKEETKATDNQNGDSGKWRFQCTERLVSKKMCLIHSVILICLSNHQTIPVYGL